MNSMSPIPSLQHIENLYIRSVLKLHNGNRTKAAKALGINRRTLLRKLSVGLWLPARCLETGTVVSVAEKPGGWLIRNDVEVTMSTELQGYAPISFDFKQEASQ